MLEKAAPGFPAAAVARMEEDVIMPGLCYGVTTGGIRGIRNYVIGDAIGEGTYG